MPKAKPSIPGERFSRLVVIQDLGHRNYRRFALCSCDCGNQSTVDVSLLRSGHTTSCGCYFLERQKTRTRTHGHSSGGKTKEYRAWKAMKARCNNDSPGWENYGGRGIVVCDEWNASFPAFLEHVGYAPTAEHSLDRINNDGNYEPGNVRWATRSEQMLNRRKYVRKINRPFFNSSLKE